MPIGLVLSDHDPIALHGLEQLFRLEEDFKVLACCPNGKETLQAVRKHQPDVLIFGLDRPGRDGLAVIREMRKEKLPNRVVVLTRELDEDDVVKLINLGVRGVVLKEMAAQLLVRCIRKVHAGGRWLETRSFGGALEKMVRREAGARQMAEILTPRELQVVRVVAGGLRNKAIAAKLFISESTVKIHLNHIFEKLHVRSRMELILYTQDRGVA